MQWQALPSQGALAANSLLVTSDPAKQAPLSKDFAAHLIKSQHCITNSREIAQVNSAVMELDGMTQQN